MSGRTRVYIGKLPKGIREKDIEELFRKYGKIEHLDFRTNKEREPFAFIDYSDSRDAEDAIKGRDGYEIDGVRIRVEFPRSFRDRDDGGRGFRGGGGGGGGGFSRDRGGGGGGGGFSRDSGFRFNRNRYDNTMRRSQYRVLISGIPASGSWQDLKDHMRKAGDVCYADVSKDGTGVVEFVQQEDMKYAVKKLDDTKFRSHEGETAYIRVRADDRTGGGGDLRRSRSPLSPPPRRRTRTRSRSPIVRRGASPDLNGKDRDFKRERTVSRSRSRSMHSKSRTKSRSVTRSPP